jgi:hypothetical protein
LSFGAAGIGSLLQIHVIDFIGEIVDVAVWDVGWLGMWVEIVQDVCIGDVVASVSVDNFDSWKLVGVAGCIDGTETFAQVIVNFKLADILLALQHSQIYWVDRIITWRPHFSLHFVEKVIFDGHLRQQIVNSVWITDLSASTEVIILSMILLSVSVCGNRWTKNVRSSICWRINILIALVIIWLFTN